MSAEPILNYSHDFYRKEGFSKRLSSTKRWRSTLLPKKALTPHSRALQLLSPRYCPTVDNISSVPLDLQYAWCSEYKEVLVTWFCVRFECLNVWIIYAYSNGLSLLLQILGKAPKPGHVFCAKRAEPAEQVLHQFPCTQSFAHIPARFNSISN